MEIKLGEQIAALRRESGMTQDALAAKLGVTNQAVSKWESGMNYPDVTLIPAIAEVFGVTTDRLFFGAATAPSRPSEGCRPKVLKDDDVYRILQFKGRKLISRSENGEPIRITFDDSMRSLRRRVCFEVYGNVESGAIYGNVKSEGSVDCKEDVMGNVSVRGDLRCGGSIQGNAASGGDLASGGDIRGNVSVSGSLTCGEISGNVKAGADVRCSGDIRGAVKAGGDISR